MKSNTASWSKSLPILVLGIIVSVLFNISQLKFIAFTTAFLSTSIFIFFYGIESILYLLIFFIPFVSLKKSIPLQLFTAEKVTKQVDLYIHFYDVIIIFLLAYVLIQWAKHKTYSQKIALFLKQNKILSVFLLYVSITFFITKDKLLFIDSYIAILKSVAIYFLIIILVTDKNRLFRLIFTFTLSIIAQSFFAIMQQFGFTYGFFDEDAIFEWKNYLLLINTSIFRSQGTFSHPNYFGAYLATIIPINSVFLFLQKKKIFIWCIATALFLGAISCVLTFSRAAWFGLMLGPLILGRLIIYRVGLKKLLASAKHMKGKKYIAILIFCLIVIFAVFMIERLNIEADITNSLQTRIDLIKESLNIIKDRPIFGIGLGNFRNTLAEGRDSTTAIGGVFINPVHNGYLEIISETGIIGFILLFYFVKQQLMKAIKQLNKQNYLLYFGIVTSITIFLILLAFTNIEEEVLIPFFIVIGILNSALMLEKSAL